MSEQTAYSPSSCWFSSTGRSCSTFCRALGFSPPCSSCPSSFPYARPAGMGKAFKDGGTKSVLCAAFCYTLLLLLLPGVVAEFSGTAFVMGTGALSAWLISMTAAFSIALLFAVFFARYAARHLGGLTGDVYGAITTLVEALVLLSFLLFPSFLPFPC